MSLSQYDYLLIQQYKAIFNLNNINTDSSGNFIYQNSLSLTSILYVSGNSLFNNSITTLGNLNVLGNSILNNVTSNNTLNISGNTILKSLVDNNLNISNTTIFNNNLNISNLTIINGNLSINSNLNILSLFTLKNSILTTNIFPTNNSINIINPVINIGGSNSIININGTSIFVSSTELNIIDKIISLNLNSNNIGPADNGFDSGILILGTSNSGFIKTTMDASRYIIKAPNDDNTNYIGLLDFNNNLNISGTTILNNTTILSSLYVLGLSIFNDSVTLNNLNVLNTTNINNSVTINNNLNIGLNCNINGDITLQSSLNISNNTIINESITINSYLNNLGSTLFNNTVSINSSLNINNINLNNLTILNTLNILNNSNFYNISINNSLNVLTDSSLNNTSNNTSLTVSGYSNINGNININNSLFISGNTTIFGNITINSGININGNIIQTLPDYKNNLTAKNNGVPIWGWYRTGGILKIRLNDILPIVYLNNNSILYIIFNTNYYDPGVYSFDYLNNPDPVYMISLLNNNNINFISRSILITGTSSLIPIVNTLPIGNYTATYQATDFIGNVGYNYRTISIINIYQYNFNLGALWTTSKIDSIDNVYSLQACNYWTVEGYVYLTSYSTSLCPLIDNRNSSLLNGIVCSITYDTTYQLVVVINNNIIYSNSAIINVNKWYHVVFQRNNNYLQFYVNGVKATDILLNSTNLANLNIINGVNQLTVGATLDSRGRQANWINGYLSSVRITRSLVYANNFYSPTFLLSLPNTIFLLGNNYNDLIQNKQLTIVGTVPNSILLLNPIVTLKGFYTLFVNLNTNYIDSGLIAIDYFGNSITNYTVTGTVNTAALEQYILTYTVADYSGQVTNINRFINVINDNSIYNDLIYWIDPSNIKTVNIDNNNNIITISDQINNIIMIPNEIIPKYKINAINNLAVIDCTEYKPDYFQGLKSNIKYMNSYDVTLAIVFTSFYSSPNTGIIWGHYADKERDISLRYNVINGTNSIHWHTDNDYSLSNNLTNLPEIPVIFVGTLSYGYNRFFKMINLLTGDSTYISCTSNITMALAQNYLYLCSNRNQPTLFYIGECMYWKKVLSASEIYNVESYLYLKWSSNRNIKPVLTLSGFNYVITGNTYIDLGVSLNYILNPQLSVYITSITDINNNELLTSPILSTKSTTIPMSIINTSLVINSDPIINSLYFNTSGQYLKRTFLSNSSTKWTISFWMYYSSKGGYSILSSNDGSGFIYIYNGISLRTWCFNNLNQFINLLNIENIPIINSWYHIVLIYDSTQVIANNRYLCYYNNILQTNPNSNVILDNIIYEFANSTTFYIGNRSQLDSQYYGYLSQFIYVDNQALLPNNFGYYFNNKWVAKIYTGTFGSTGFYLNFSNSSNPGLDVSGNNNNWTLYNLNNLNIVNNNIIPQVFLPSNEIITSASILSVNRFNITYTATDTIYFNSATITRNIYVVINNNVISLINNWINRVTEAGGILSQIEINAHLNFLVYLNYNNVISCILRLNTFCGDSLNAALCPIIIDGGLSNNGASLNDTIQIDTSNQIISPMKPLYYRTGGITGTFNKSNNQYAVINTGLKLSTISNNGQNLHMGMYAFTALQNRVMGVTRVSVYTRTYLLYDAQLGSTGVGWGNQANISITPSLGMNIIQCRSNDIPYYYSNGIKANITYMGGNTQDLSRPSDWPCVIFGCQGTKNDGTIAGTNSTNAVYGKISDVSNTRSGGYTIGYGLTDTQAIYITNAFNLLNTALGRS